ATREWSILMQTRRELRVVLSMLAGTGAIVVAAMLDGSMARFVHDSGIASFMKSHRTLAAALKFPGEYLCTAIVIVIVSLQHQLRWRAGVFVFLATLLSGINGLAKWIMGRWRPYSFPQRPD